MIQKEQARKRLGNRAVLKRYRENVQCARIITIILKKNNNKGVSEPRRLKIIVLFFVRSDCPYG